MSSFVLSPPPDTFMVEDRDGLREHPRDAFAEIPPHAGIHVTGGGIETGGHS